MKSNLNSSELAPIALFVYNRVEHTQKTLKALAANELADESELFIYADGPKANATSEDLASIKKVRSLIRSKQWCKEVRIIESEKNKGLADSIVSGVTQVVNEYGKVIVLEDDIVTSRGFLMYMNEALKIYETEEKVFHIAGYVYPTNRNLPENFFYNVPVCWGWATWSRAWKLYKTDVSALIRYFDEKRGWIEFNKLGGHVLEDQLRANATGRLKTWFVKWHASILMQNGYCLFPGRSLVCNIGFDGSGVHNEPTQAFVPTLTADYASPQLIPLRESRLAEVVFKTFYFNLWKYSRVRAKPSFTKTLARLVPFSSLIKKIINKTIRWGYPELAIFRNGLINRGILKSEFRGTAIGKACKIEQPFYIYDSLIGDYSQLGSNSFMNGVIIGRFCFVGANFKTANRNPIHAGITASPLFYTHFCIDYSSLDNNDSKESEAKMIVIGNDVWIGADVTVLEGITINDGAVVAASTTVSENIPAYAIVEGNPMRVTGYRFNEFQREALLKIKWWYFNEDELKKIHIDILNIDKFIKHYKNAEDLCYNNQFE